MKRFLFSILIFGLFGFANFSFASVSILNQDFESFSVGTLNSGEWTQTAGSETGVVSSPVYEGYRAFHTGDFSNGMNYNPATPVTINWSEDGTGILSYYFRFANPRASIATHPMMYFQTNFSDGYNGRMVYTYFCGVSNYTYQLKMSTSAIGNGGCTGNLQGTNLTANNWYKVEYLLDTNDDTVKGRIDEGNWTTPISLSSFDTTQKLISAYWRNTWSNDENSYIDKFFYSSAPASDTIDDPVNGSYQPVGAYTFSGQCTHKGLHYSMNWRDFNFSSTPNITCQNDYTWSNSYNIEASGGGGRAYYLYNHETEEYIYVAVIGYVSDTLDWLVDLQYPALDSKGYAKVKADDEFPFRIQYRVPEVDRNSVSIVMRKCDSDYSSNCTTVLNNSLQYFDENKTGFFEFVEDLSTIGYYYYDLDIVDDNLSTVEYNRKIKIEAIDGEASEAGDVQQPFLPDKKDLGYLGNQIRDLFVPQYGYIGAMTGMLKDDFSAKFSSIITVKDSFISSFANIGTTSLGNLPHITIYGANVAPLDLQFIDPYISQFKLFMSAGMYLVCAIFLIRKTATIFKS